MAVPRLPALEATFDAAMADLGPFEPAPFLAVAISGGADSTALLLLAARWAAARGGRLLALTVDHGLRPEAALEAQTLGVWLQSLGIAHEILVWQGTKPCANVQDVARHRRYQLLAQRCHDAGCLHLLTGHQADDLAETFLLRLGRGSGLSGLASMAAEVALGPVRLLRPLLGLRRKAIEDALQPLRLELVDDPGNRAPRFARARVRTGAAALQSLGLGASRLAEASRHLRRARSAVDNAAAVLALEAVRLNPAGFATLDPNAFARAPEEVGLRLLAELLANVGGSAYPPRFTALERLHCEIAGIGLSRGRTLAGCRILPRRDGILICREVAGCAAPAAAPTPGSQLLLWDGRFRITAGRALRSGAQSGLFWGALLARNGLPMTGGVPPVACPTLPALRDEKGLLAVPHLTWEREAGWLGAFDVFWRPSRIASGIAAGIRYIVV